MQRRLFLQLLGLGGAAATLPLITSEASASVAQEGFQHFVLREGSYTGRIFDGGLWLKGVNAGFPSWMSPVKYALPQFTRRYGLSELDEAPSIDMEGSRKAIEKYNLMWASSSRWPQDPGVGERIGQGLALFREELREEIEALWKRSGANPEEASLVTVVQEPLHCSFRPDFTTYGGEKREAELTIHLHRRHYILEGRLKPGILWSDSGRIPLEDDFVREDAQHQFLHFRGDQRRSNVVLDNHQSIPEDAPSLADRHGHSLIEPKA